ncbi:hypothetical protein B1H29_01185 [Streptomyces pactum]|uniref:Uncharacterized protein n=1 Tax=Streptomyces pactum TaxID=68249 RepID=A0A1S6J1W3_9ACTN|nr:hypothetical protein B1H29_01185 [Streptomyces pactum]
MPRGPPLFQHAQVPLILRRQNRHRQLPERAAPSSPAPARATAPLPPPPRSWSRQWTRPRHWRVLREAGLVYQRDAGNGLYMRLRKDDLDRRFPGLNQAVIAAD